MLEGYPTNLSHVEGKVSDWCLGGVPKIQHGGHKFEGFREPWAVSKSKTQNLVQGWGIEEMVSEYYLESLRYLEVGYILTKWN